MENKGQWDNRVLYKTDAGNGSLYLEKGGLTYYFYDNDTFSKYVHAGHSEKKVEMPKAIHMKYHVVRKTFVDANKDIRITPLYATHPYYNFFIGNDKSEWASGVKAYSRVLYSNVYDDIDLLFYKYQQTPKYDIVVRPGGDVSKVKFAYEGADALTLENGKLRIKTTVNHYTEAIPEAYQFIGEKKIKVDCAYALEESNVSFKLGSYDPAYTVYIDPVLIFVTYSGSTADNFGFTATYDSRANFYLGGNVTYPSKPNGRYPASAGAFQDTIAVRNGSSGVYSNFPCDMAISKYDSSGENLVWATYIGGGDNDYPHSLVVDNQDRLIILGSSWSHDFPVDTLGFQKSLKGFCDIVVVKLGPDATFLEGATFIGGNRYDGVSSRSTLVYNYADDFRGDVIVDDENNVILASCTRSMDFPLKNNLDSLKGGLDGVVCILDSNLRNLLFSTPVGGSGDDALYSLQLDDSLNLFCAGGTNSVDLPTTAGAYQKNYAGGRTDGFMYAISLSERSKKALSYFGTNAYDQVYFIDIDAENNVYVSGQTEGQLPVINATFANPNTSQFITKFKNELDTILMQMTFGNRPNNPELSPTAFLVDNCDNIYFSGWGSDFSTFQPDPNYPAMHDGTTTGLSVSPDADFPNTDGQDFYFLVLAPNSSSRIYATYFGGTLTEDHVDGGTSRFDKRGVIYQAICGSCPTVQSGPGPVSDMPTTANSVFPVNVSPRCSNTSIKMDFNISYAVDAKFLATPIIGCLPLKVNFTNKSLNATHVFWDFGDGTTDTTYHAEHTYTKEGIYYIKLKILDPASCNLSDSAVKKIEVLIASKPDFEYTAEGCLPLDIQFTNKSSRAISFRWIFPDSSTSTEESPKKKFPAPGNYEVKLISNPGTACADTITKSVKVNALPNASNLIIPNVFTPNNNNLNECFGIGGNVEYCDKMKFKIYDRWGILIFDSEKNGLCWNGTNPSNGREVPEGVYFALVTLERFSGEKEEYRGSLTLFR